MNLLTFLLCSAGITVILTLSKLFKPIRPKPCFFHCLMCMGWWTGLLLWFVSLYIDQGLFIFDSSPLTGFLLACASSISSWILGYFGVFLEEKS